MSAGDGVVVHVVAVGQHRGEHEGEACEELHYFAWQTQTGKKPPLCGWSYDQTLTRLMVDGARPCPVAVLPSVVH